MGVVPRRGPRTSRAPRIISRPWSSATGFAGLSRVKQHQLVYGALGALMDGPVHALTFKTYTPDRWATLGGAS